jgi:hypothetical protein
MYSDCTCVLFSLGEGMLWMACREMDGYGIETPVALPALKMVRFLELVSGRALLQEDSSLHLL